MKGKASERDPFAGYTPVKVPVPVGYERVLTTLYGDYMKFPPKEKRAQWHDGHIIDADVPWRECVARHRRPGK